jgi:peroxiredoxin
LAVLAVNVEGSAKRHERFIQSNEYSYLQWARDTSRQVARDYRVSGVPTTYILDDQGIVQHVHIGWGAQYKKLLVREIDSLLE